MIKILFICHGNICRSPMAEFVMKRLAADAGLGSCFGIASAATTTEEIWGRRGNPVYPPAKKTLAEHGIAGPEVDAKRARLLVRDDYAYYDYLIGMDSENLSDMKDICGVSGTGRRADYETPDSRTHSAAIVREDEKISLLMDYTGRPRSVADPWYTGNFEATWNDVCEGCTALLQHLCRVYHLRAGS